MSREPDEVTPLAEEQYDPLLHLRKLAKQALASPADLTREQIQELGYALLTAIRLKAGRHLSGRQHDVDEPL